MDFIQSLKPIAVVPVNYFQVLANSTELKSFDYIYIVSILALFIEL